MAQTFPRRRAEVLRAIGPDKGAKRDLNDIRPHISQEYMEVLSQTVGNMVQTGLLKSEPSLTGRNRIYSLSDTGRAILKELDTLDLVDAVSRPAADKARPAQAGPQFNISPTANTLAEQLSAVFAENESYRNLLLQIHNTITQALQLKEDSTDGSTRPPA